jgi:hypothetical protein
VRLLLVIALVACSSSSDDGARRERPPREGSQRVLAAQPDPKPDPVGDLPVECGLYKALVGRMSRCEALGPQRALLEKQFETSWKAWSALPQSERAGVSTSCKAAADAVRAATVSCPP